LTVTAPVRTRPETSTSGSTFWVASTRLRARG
jgi:hypothetical protein